MRTRSLGSDCPQIATRGSGLAAAAILAILGACNSNKDAATQANDFVQGTTKQITDVKPINGFLPQPALLKPGTAEQFALTYYAPGLDPKVYANVMLEPVSIWSGQDSTMQSVPADQRQDLINTFHTDLSTALTAAHCQMVQQPGPGTIRLRFAITDETTPNASVNTVATYAPYASSAYDLASRVFNKGVGYFAGTATIEGYATDGKTGALLWEGVDKRGGTIAYVENTLDTWLDIHRAFQDWSAQIATKLQKVGVCH